MARTYVSYRRQDVPNIVGRITDRLRYQMIDPRLPREGTKDCIKFDLLTQPKGATLTYSSLRAFDVASNSPTSFIGRRTLI